MPNQLIQKRMGLIIKKALKTKVTIPNKKNLVKQN
jgi:hypothetical protein